MTLLLSTKNLPNCSQPQRHTSLSSSNYHQGSFTREPPARLINSTPQLLQRYGVVKQCDSVGTSSSSVSGLGGALFCHTFPHVWKSQPFHALDAFSLAWLLLNLSPNLYIFLPVHFFDLFHLLSFFVTCAWVKLWPPCCRLRGLTHGSRKSTVCGVGGPGFEFQLHTFSRRME